MQPQGMSNIPTEDLDTTHRVLSVMASEDLSEFVVGITTRANKRLADVQATCEAYDRAKKSLEDRIALVKKDAWVIFAQELDLRAGASESEEASKIVWKLRNDAVILHKQTFATSKKLNEIHLDICLELRRNYETLRTLASEVSGQAVGELRQPAVENGSDVTRSIVWFIPGLLDLKAVIERYHTIVGSLDEKVDTRESVERLVNLLAGFRAMNRLSNGSIESLSQYLNEQGEILGGEISEEVGGLQSSLADIRRVLADNHTTPEPPAVQ